MSADWGAELYESGFKYYQIPQEYIDEGGCFPEAVQAYLWCLCEERGINYYVVVALIEREQYLESIGVDTSDMDEQAIKEANTGSHVFLKGTISILDAIEDIDIFINKE